jgi:hypothetical protein
MLTPERTEYDKGSPRTFYVASIAGVYNELCQKYGGNNCFLGTNQKPIVDALSQTMAGRGDRILIFPGTYTTSGTSADGTAITISKANVTIESATGNAADVNIVAESDCELFSLAATADGTQFKNLAITPDTSGTTPQDGIEVISGCAGVVIDGCVFVGADAGTVAIDSEGDRLVVKNCRFEDFKYAIQSNGANCVFENNYFNTDNTAAVCLELTAGNWCEVLRNRFDASGGTGDTGLKIAAGCLLGQCVGNVFHASLNDSINPVAGTTMSFQGNEETGTTATIAYIVT